MLRFDITLEDCRVIGVYEETRWISGFLVQGKPWTVSFHGFNTKPKTIFLTPQECQALLTMCMTMDETLGNFPTTDAIEENARKIIDPIIGILPMELRPYPCLDLDSQQQIMEQKIVDNYNLDQQLEDDIREALYGKTPEQNNQAIVEYEDLMFGKEPTEEDYLQNSFDNPLYKEEE